MATCRNCGTTIVFGGERDGEHRFCNKTCMNAHLSSAPQVYGAMIPADVLAKHTVELHQGECPECRGPGPVDIHQGYQVWSFLIATQWRTVPKLCCRGCARKHQLKLTGMSVVAGWWGFPWGLLMTPIQIGRNVFAMFGGPDPARPSPELQTFVHHNISLYLQEQHANEQ